MPTFNIDGVNVKPEHAQISVMDHGLLYGDGVFEGLRFYEQQIFKCEDHLKRLADSALAIGLRLPMSDQAMRDAMANTIKASGQRNGYIRLLVTRGAGSLGIDTSTCLEPKTIVIVDQLALVQKETLEQGIDVIIATTRRLAPDQLDPRVKTLNYLNNILARNEATAAGAQEAIMLNQQGRVAEGSADNVFIVRNGVLKTPPPSEGALAGITRQTILDLAQSCKLETAEVPLSQFDLMTADECFLTGTGAELIPVKRIGQVSLRKPRPIFRQLQDAFTELVTSDNGPVSQLTG